ncbi:MAG: vWA domain-containing protein [Planctomycetota bacterium]|jgi:Ca-activated chloride channel family protein
MARESQEILFQWVPEVPVLRAGPAQDLHVLITASAAAAAEERTPLNLGLVLDRSGSMRGSKIRSTLESARILVEHLSERDRLSIVFYDSEVETVLHPTAVKDRRAIMKVLEDVRPKGTTNLSGGWLQGLRLVEKARSKGSANRVLLMTDGLANRGITDAPSLKKVAEKSRSKGVITTTLGFGKGFNEDLLTGVATTSGGNFYFIQDPDDAPKAFSTELGELMGLAAQNLQGRIRFGPGVRFREILNPYPVRTAEGNLEVFVGDVFSGEKRAVLLRLDVEVSGEGEHDVFSASFEYDDLLAGGEAKNASVDGAIKVDAEGPPSGERHPDIALAVAMFRCGEAKSKAKDLADKGNLDEGARLLEEALRRLADLPDLPEVEKERKELRQFADDFKNRSFNAVDRKSLSASIFRSQIGRISQPPDGKNIVDTRVENEAKPKKRKWGWRK